MLVSQAELVASLKAEAARSREAASGAVKAAAEAERAADARAARRGGRSTRVGGGGAAGAGAGRARGERDAPAADVSDLKRTAGERDATLGYVGAEVESVKTMFATREEDLRRERDELAALVAERDEHEAAVRNEANAARGEDAARAKAEAAEALADLAEKRESVDRVEAEAKETVRRVEGGNARVARGGGGAEAQDARTRVGATEHVREETSAETSRIRLCSLWVIPFKIAIADARRHGPHTRADDCARKRGRCRVRKI